MMPPAASRAILLFLLVGSSAGAAHAGPFGFTRSRASAAHPLVLLAPRPTPDATLRIQFGAGSHQDGNLPGLTRLAQHAMIRANAQADFRAFMLDAYAAGASLEIETGMHDSALTLTAPGASFESLAGRLLRMCLAPRIEARDFEHARGRMLEDGLFSNPGGLASVLTGYVFLASGHDFDPLGDEASIQQISLAQVNRHIAAHLSPANSLVAVAGSFSARRVLALVNQHHGGGRATPQPAPMTFSGNYRVEGPYEIYMLAYPLELETTEQIAATHILGAMLQERVQRKFRHLGIAYSTDVRPIHHLWIDFIMVFLPVYRESGSSIEQVVQEQIDRLREPAAREDFLRNQAYLLHRLASDERDSLELALGLARSRGTPGWYGRELVDEIRKATFERFVTTTGGWLNPRSRVQVSFSPKISN